MFPTITKLSDLQRFDLRESFLSTCKYSLEDHIYFFPRPQESYKFVAGANLGGAVFAGSSALAHLIDVWPKDVPCKVSPSFTPNDTDLFLLNRPEGGRHKNFLAHIDIVHMTEKSVEELLMNFDLPICRVAMDAEYNIWVSAQALNAIMTGEYYLPTYFDNIDMFNDLLRKYQWSQTTLKTPGFPTKMILPAEKMLFERLQGRIKKYADRGFSACYINTERVMPWIKQRFCYVDWDNLVPSREAPVPTPVSQPKYELTSIAEAFLAEPTIRKVFTSYGLVKSNEPQESNLSAPQLTDALIKLFSSLSTQATPSTSSVKIRTN